MLALTLGALSFSVSTQRSLVAPSVSARQVVPVASLSRRELAVGAALAAGTLCSSPMPALAADIKTVVVAGATGQTGRRCVQRLAQTAGISVIGGVRDPEKAAKKLAESKIEIRGAMVQQGVAIDSSKVELKAIDVEKQSVADMTGTLTGADGLIIAVGFVPGNPFKMNAAAHAVDNVGTVALIDAAKAAGVKKVVLVSSILTDAGAWGQLDSAGYKVTNAFGSVLEEKLVAEKYPRPLLHIPPVVPHVA